MPHLLDNTLRTAKLLTCNIVTFLVDHVVVNMLLVGMIGPVCPGGQCLSLANMVIFHHHSQQLDDET